MSFRVVCPVCGKNEATELFKKQGSTFVQCREDKLVYVNLQPDREELQGVYDTYGREIFVSPESIASTGITPITGDGFWIFAERIDCWK